jgi:sugar phosphate isomerase/epimerase
MGQKLPLGQMVEIVAQAGYGAIEPWISHLERHVQEGGSLKDIAKRVRDHGLIVPDAIGFFEWIVDDDARRKKGFEEAKRYMGLAQQVGCQRLAAPPLGATNQTDLNLRRAAERYRALLELGDQFGVVPQVELWGGSKAMSRLGECAFVALESGHPRACILPDVFHLYKGGNSFATLKLLGPDALQMLHLNDYPATPARNVITDAQRVYPGDGVAPLKQIVADLRRSGFRGVLSLELFNRDYWKQDALRVARTGLEKMRAIVQASAGSQKDEGGRGVSSRS